MLFFEDLNISGMKRLWGRKIHDSGFAQFLKIVIYQCQKTGAQVKLIDRFYPSSKQCHKCFAIKQDLLLRERNWRCTSCSTEHLRDLNAAINIARVGASTLGLGNVRPAQLAIAV
jgi:putative transposase